MTSTTWSTRNWYSCERRLAISCRSPNTSSAMAISTTAAKARSRRVRRLIAYLGPLTSCDQQSAIPFRGDAGSAAPHDSSQPRLDQRDDRLGIEPASAVHQHLDVPARVERTTVEGDDVAGIVSAPPCRGEGLAGQCGCVQGCPRADDPEAAHRGSAVAAAPGPRDRPTRRSAKSREAASRRVVDDSRGRVRIALAARMARPRSPATSATRTAPPPPVLHPERHRRRGPAALPPTAREHSRVRRGVRRTWIRCHSSGTD